MSEDEKLVLQWCLKFVEGGDILGSIISAIVYQYGVGTKKKNFPIIIGICTRWQSFWVILKQFVNND